MTTRKQRKGKIPASRKRDPKDPGLPLGPLREKGPDGSLDAQHGRLRGDRTSYRAEPAEEGAKLEE
jgi:hypothetical protein